MAGNEPRSSSPYPSLYTNYTNPAPQSLALETWIQSTLSHTSSQISILITASHPGAQVGTATDYGLDDRTAGNFSLRHQVQTSSGAHPVSFLMETTGYFPRGKAAGAWSWPSPPSRAEVKNAWSYTSTPQYFYTAWCLVKHRDNFTFTLSCLGFPSGVFLWGSTTTVRATGNLIMILVD
jgi:hypothetical protein